MSDPVRFLTALSQALSTLGLYGAAKVLESADGLVFRVTGFVSGHTLKHLVAALAGAALIVMLQVREDATPTGSDMEVTR